MGKYVILSAPRRESRTKEAVTSSLIKEMKRQGFRKHHVAVEAENEKMPLTR